MLFGATRRWILGILAVGAMPRPELRVGCCVLARVCGPSTNNPLEVTVRREYERGAACTRHMCRHCLAGDARGVLELDAVEPSGSTISGPAPETSQREEGVLFAAGCGGGFGRGSRDPALLRDPNPRGGRVLLPEHVPAPTSAGVSTLWNRLGCYAAVAACAVPRILGIEDNSRYPTVRALDGDGYPRRPAHGVLFLSLRRAMWTGQSRKATPRFLAERCRERHTTDIEQRRDKHEPPGPLLPKKNNSYDDLATAIESAAQGSTASKGRLENKARHAARCSRTATTMISRPMS